jgi:hypothetical protein
LKVIDWPPIGRLRFAAVDLRRLQALENSAVLTSGPSLVERRLGVEFRRFDAG